MTQRCYTIQNLLQINACTGCSMCVDVCPAFSSTLDHNLSGYYRLEALRRIILSRSGILQKLFKKTRFTEEQLKEFALTVFRCTLCGRCQEICPAGIRLKDIWLSLREDLVQSKSAPGKVHLIKENVVHSHNVFGEDNEERAEWVEDVNNAPDHQFIKAKAEIVYFTGCVSSYFPMVQGIPTAFAEIFVHAGVNFSLLGEDEWCCGFPLFGAGMREAAEDIIFHNVEAVKAKGADSIVFSCPSCFQMWRELYPPEFKLYHSSQYLLHLITTGRLALKGSNQTVTYHDPCDLGRGSREFEAPRKILQAIDGIRLVEMEQNRENCLCCGGGGNLEMVDAALSSDIARLKMDAIRETGADIVVTACQQCIRTITGYARKNKIALKTMDIIQLVRASLIG